MASCQDGKLLGSQTGGVESLARGRPSRPAEGEGLLTNQHGFYERKISLPSLQYVERFATGSGDGAWPGCL